MSFANRVQAMLHAMVELFSPSQRPGDPVQSCPAKPRKVELVTDGAKYITGSTHYKDCPQGEKDKIKSKTFTDDEAKQVNEVLGKYAPLMKCENQPLKKIARANRGITDCLADKTTMGECFSEFGTLVMMDAASDPIDFSDADQQFKGTMAHEISHIVMNEFDPRTCKQYGSPDDNPLIQEWRKQTGWDATGTTLTETDTDKAPTDYARNNNSQEDMAESAMLYLYDEDKLKDASPERYAFMKKLFGD